MGGEVLGHGLWSYLTVQCRYLYGYQIIINLHVSLDWHALCPLTIINSLEGKSTAQGEEKGIDGASAMCTQDWVGEE